MDTKETYTIEEAVKLAKKNCKCKFDSTVEVHFNLNLDIKDPQQNVRFLTTLPHGTGKTKKVAVFASKKVPNADLELTEKDLTKIKNGDLKPKTDFDILIAEPKFMPKIASVAKILGPAGVMPNPKAGTITEEVEKVVEETKEGKVEIRTEQKAPIIHTILGKKSFDNKILVENFKELFKSLKKNKPQKAKPSWIKSCFLTTSMGPSIQVDTAVS